MLKMVTSLMHVPCYEEWIVDGVDPDDGEVEFTFVPDLTRLVEDN